MNKKRKLLLSLFFLALVLLGFSQRAYAISPQSKSVPVTLTVLKPARMISVTVPSSLPILVNGSRTYVAEGAEIRNNDSEATVYVSDVFIKSGTFSVGNYENFTGNRSVALCLNGIGTKKEGALAITPASFPDIGPGRSLPLRYNAKVSPVGVMKEKPIAEAIFTIALRSE